MNTDGGAVTSPDDAVRHPVVRASGRVGLLAYGVVHLMLAGLLVQVAFGDRERVDKKGALATLAETGPGVLLLWIIAIGLTAMVVWQFGEAIWEHDGLPLGRRVLRSAVNLAEAALFGVLAYSAWSFATSGGRPSPSRSFATVVFELPGGRWLVALGGLGVIIGSAYAARRGVTGGFLRDLDLRGAGLNRSQLVTRIGRLGWAALGVAYGIPGVLLVVAGLTYDPAVPTGLDAGLQRVSDEPYGPLLLVLLALGLVAFGVYCLFDARYRKA
ncbi:MAG TPA: DUF1206 domain-containing protein [Pseudonocardia sp.]|jgi:hypothetical protein|nr:DUF1206 domain-containing protein [Pseudonocardia sp.]